ncbi:MAG: hypothetical protein CEE38_03770 [Planctomycetes bacterium B3_Pla]|nr:MAG: hypothetical protein CEE38_03770 [Planctomycetes bacterium B3_Pla]
MLRQPGVQEKFLVLRMLYVVCRIQERQGKRVFRRDLHRFCRDLETLIIDYLLLIIVLSFDCVQSMVRFIAPYMICLYA